MKLILIFATAQFLFSSGQALADIYADGAEACTAALNVGDRQAFENAAQDILDWRSVFNTAAILKARDCLTRGFEEEWEYHTPSARFMRTSDLESERAAYEQRAAKAAQEAAELEEDRRRQEIAADRDRAAAAKLYGDRRAEVRLAMIEACGDLFEDDEVEALTNNVCIEVFMTYGLPER